MYRSNTRAKIVLLVIAAVFVLIVFQTASFKRGVRSFFSNITGGLNRVVTLYDYEGKAIRSWEGKIDLSESDQEIFFDLDGKRVIIHGGIVVAEEK